MKRLVSLGISLLLLAALLLSLDTQKVFAVLGSLRMDWFLAALFLFIPQTLVIVWRWQYLIRPLAKISSAEGTRQVLSASSLNLVLPSKLGDLAKGVFIYRHGHCSLKHGLGIVVFEKLLDFAALSVWLAAGWLLWRSMEPLALAMLAIGTGFASTVLIIYFFPRPLLALLNMIPAPFRQTKIAGKIISMAESGPAIVAITKTRGIRRADIFALSLTIWALHLIQIWMFFLAAGADVTLVEIFARMPVAIYAGLLPLTIAGIGIRDWAIVAIFAPLGPAPETLAAVGLLVSLRYVIPAAAGLPFAGKYLVLGREMKDSPTH